MMLPISVDLGSLHLTPSRTLFLVICPFLLINLLSGKYGKLNGVDGFVLTYMAWRTMIPFIHNPNVALQYAGSNTLIFLGGYLAARASVRSASDFRIAARLLGGFVIFAVPFAIVETITGRLIIPRFLEMIPFVSSVKDVMYERRFGLDRVQFVFAHPILYGLFCSLGVAIYFMAMKGQMTAFRRWISSGLMLVAVFLSVSSGPFLATVAQIGLLSWAFLLRNIGPRWKILGALVVLGYIVIEIGSNRPGIYAVITLLSFDPSTANVRLILFDYGMRQIWRTPLLGVGFNQWELPSWMTGSLDNFWLANAIIFGVPAFFLLFMSFLWALISVGRRDFRRGSTLSDLRLGWGAVIVSIMLTLATVYVWNEIASLVMFVLGMGVFLLYAQEDDGAAVAPDAAAAAGPDRDRSIRYTRFPEEQRPASPPPAKPDRTRR